MYIIFEKKHSVHRSEVIEKEGKRQTGKQKNRQIYYQNSYQRRRKLINMKEMHKKSAI